MKGKTPRKGAGSSTSKPSNSNESVDDINEEFGGAFREEEEDEDEPTAANTDHVDREKGLFPIVSLYLQWIRRLVSHTEAINTLCQMGCQMVSLPDPPSLSVKVLAVAHTGVQLKPWEDIIQSIWTDVGGCTAQDVIDQLHDDQVVSLKKGTQPIFRGTLHCEACLMSLLSLGLLGDEVRASCFFYNMTC
jgi:hypothetical protein